MLVVLGLTGAWWWQNHQAQQAEIVTMADQSSAQLSQNGGQSVPLSDDNSDPANPVDTQAPVANSQPSTPTENGTVPATSSAAPADTANNGVNTTAPQGTTSAESAVVSPSQAPLPSVSTAQPPLPTADAGVTGTTSSADSLVMNFTADCWLQVVDASGKTLFSGIQKGARPSIYQGKRPIS